MKRISLVVLFSALLFILVPVVTACGNTSIGDIVNNPSKYQGKSVTVKGTVGETVWFALLNKGGYQLGDNSGTIWIITNRPPPQKGMLVTTSGTVEAAFSLGGQSFGTIVNETNRSQ